MCDLNKCVAVILMESAKVLELLLSFFFINNKFPHKRESQNNWYRNYLCNKKKKTPNYNSMVINFSIFIFFFFFFFLLLAR